MVFTLIILAIVLCLLAACAKGAARFLRFSRVTWRLGFGYAGAVLAVSLVAKLILSVLGVQFAGYAAIPVALLLQVALGAWFFRQRAFTEAGVAVGTVGAAKLSAVIFGLWLLMALALFLASGFLAPR